MGIRLVGLALNPSWSVLSDRARVVLLQMCYVARDQGTAQQAGGQYFGGHDGLIISVLGKDPDALTKSNRATCETYIKRAIRELKKAGAVTLISASSHTNTAVYQLHPNRFPNLGQEPLPVDNSGPTRINGGHIDPPNGGHIDPPIEPRWGTNTSRDGGHIDPPGGEHRGEQERHLEEDQPTQPPTQLWASEVPDLWITS